MNAFRSMSLFSPFLFPPRDLENRPQAMYPLMLSGMSKPVVGGDGGMNLKMYENPLLCQIDPYNMNMLEGDQLEVYWDALKVGDITVRAEDINQRISLFLPREHIVSGWVEKVFYRLFAADASPPLDSAALRLLVKLELPGGRDGAPNDPIGHSNLKKPGLPPELDLVDAEWAARGVPLKIENYPFRTVRDTIQLKWGSTFVRRLITEDEANSTDPITFMIDQDTILSGGDSNELLVHYEVFDEVWNASSRYSQRTYVAVDAGAWRLDPPIIKDTNSAGVIDLELLGKEDVTVQIYVSGPDFNLNDTLTMIWTGTPAIGSPLINTQSRVLTSLPKVEEFKIPNAEIRAIAKGSGDVWYKLDKANGDPPLSSKHAFAYVQGDPYFLPAPTILELIGDILEPTQPWAIVQIPVYPGMANGDLIDMVWMGTTATNDPYPHEQGHPVTAGEVGSPVKIPVDGEHIIALNNGTLDLFYRVSRDDVALYGVKESDHLPVKVQAIQADLPKPRVIEAPDDVLDHEAVTGPVTLRVDYLGTAPGDLMTYYWLGNPAGGSASDSLPITTVSAGEPVNFRIARELVEANINSIVKVRYTLKRSATGQYSYSAVLDLLIGELLGELPPPDVLEAPNGVLDPLDALNGPTVRVSYESMDTPHLIHLNWQGTPGPGSSDDQEQPGSPSRSVDFKLDPAIVGANIDRTVLVDYTVDHKGFSFISESRSLTITAFRDPQTQLPRPQITQADPVNRVLNLATFTGNAQVTVAKWPFSAAGQKVWLSLEGQTDSGATYPISLLAGVVISDAQAASGLTESVLRSELEKLGHDTPLAVICKVIFTGESDEFYALEFPRGLYTFKTRHDWVVPVIQRVADSWGEINEGGMTVDSSVTLSGIATPESTLELFDGLNSVGTATVLLNGSWTFPLNGLVPKSYRITAQARDGSGNVSDPRTFSAEALVRPSISSVTDSQGEVNNGDTIVDTRVTLIGKASAFHDVEIFDNTTASLGTATANATGDWTRVVSGLGVSAHSLTAKALYGNGEVSTARTFTITALVAPAITSVRDSRGEVNNGDTTVDTSVTLTGRASALQEVQIFDNTTVPMGNTKADNAGNWNLVLSGLSVTDHSLTAKVLYDNGAVSPPRTFTVTALNVPTIASVRDSRGEVGNGETTVDTRLSLGGRASARQEVEIFDNTTTSFGRARANDDGDWTLDISPLNQGDHSLKAQAIYGSGEFSAARTFKVTAEIVPTLTDIRDSKGSIVGATTIETTVFITGTGSSGQEIQLMDGNAPIGNPFSIPVNGTAWNTQLTGLSVKGYNIKAKALYGSGQESAAKAFFVTNAMVPTLTDIRDSKGSVVGGITVETSVTVTGTGSSGQSIQLRDGNSDIGNPVSIPSVGTNWSTPLGNLSPKGYNLKAKALYGNGQESAAKAFTVTAVVPPSITLIRNSAGAEIPPNGSTTDTRVTLTGQASIGQSVKILDNSDDKGDAKAGNNGEWSKELSGLAQGSHPMKVRALYGSGVPDSAVRSFTVLSALVFNTSPVTLSGKVYMLQGYPHLPAFGAGTSVHHRASGGQPGYTYTSSVPGVAVVNGDGLVTVRRNGWTTITAQDSAGQSKSYTVTVTGVIVCEGLGSNSWSGASSTAAGRGMRLPSMGELREIYATYGNSWPMGFNNYWSREQASGGVFRYYYVKNLNNGAEGTLKDQGAPFPTVALVVGLS